jgi:acetoacetate decarboxylase
MDPLGKIEIVEIVGAQFSVSDFVMNYGNVLHDYLAEGKK